MYFFQTAQSETGGFREGLLTDGLSSPWVKPAGQIKFSEF